MHLVAALNDAHSQAHGMHLKAWDPVSFSPKLSQLWILWTSGFEDILKAASLTNTHASSSMDAGEAMLVGAWLPKSKSGAPPAAFTFAHDAQCCVLAGYM